MPYVISGIDFLKYNPELDWSGKLFEQYTEVHTLKQQAGVYAFTLCGEIVYIGSSNNLFGRFQTHIAHMQGKTNRSSASLEKKKYFYLNKYLPYVKFEIICFYDKSISRSQLEENEYDFITRHCPIFNVNYKNGQRRWNGSEQDIDDFVNGIISMDKLKHNIMISTERV